MYVTYGDIHEVTRYDCIISMSTLRPISIVTMLSGLKDDKEII